jgi:hypothetical protein
VKPLLIGSALLVLLGGCGLTPGRDVRAYNICLARHPQHAVICEGPRQAYEVAPTIVEPRSASGRPTVGFGFEEGTAMVGRSPTPVLLHPGLKPGIPAPNG